LKITAKYLSIVLFLSISVLCISFGRQKAEWKGTIEKIDGVLNIHNPSEPIKGNAVLEMEEILRIDPADYKNIDLVSFSKIYKDKKGGIYLFDEEEVKAYQFNSNGKFLGSFIRKGQGPGEFEKGFGVSLHFIKNEIWAVRFRKISMFDQNRNFIRDLKFRKGYYPANFVDEDHFIGERQVYEGEGRDLKQLNILSLVQIFNENNKEKIVLDFLKAKNIGLIRSGKFAFADRWETPRIKWLFDRERQKVYTSINTDYKIRVMNLNGKTTLMFDKVFHNAKPTLQEKKEHINKIFATDRERILKAYPNELCAIFDLKLLPKGYLAVYSIKGFESISIDIFDENGKFQYVIEAPDDISLVNAIYTNNGVSIIRVEEDRDIYIEYRIKNLSEIFEQ